MREYYVKKGAKSARPLQLRIHRKPTEFFLKASFRDAQYVYPDLRQFSWNTLGGFSFNLLRRYNLSTRVVWRWAEDIKMVEIGVESDTPDGRKSTGVMFNMTPMDVLTATAYASYQDGTVDWMLVADDTNTYEKTVVDFGRQLPKWVRELNLKFTHNAPRTVRLDKETEMTCLN